MFFILAVVNAIIIVTAQGLWKSGADKLNSGATESQSLAASLMTYLRPEFIGGMILYGIGTLLYIFMLKKYSYFSIQTVMLSSVLIFSTIAANVIFHEQLKTLQIVGVFVLIAGVLLVSRS